MISKNCPTCGHPLTLAEQVVAECDPRQQCHFCWRRLNLAGSATLRGARRAPGLPAGRDFEVLRRAS